jgi:hypothetical protein
MVTLTALWLPILLSAVIVFVASSIMHMLLPYHHSDYKQLPEEDKVRATMRAVGLPPGMYHFPFCSHKDMNTPAAQQKFKEGPVGMLTVLPSGPPAMSKFLGLWFVYCLVVGVFTAYLCAHTMSFAAPFRAVLRIAGTVAFMAYGVANISNGIWKGQPWIVVFKEIFDGMVYALLTAATFAWLWPH